MFKCPYMIVSSVWKQKMDLCSHGLLELVLAGPDHPQAGDVGHHLLLPEPALSLAAAALVPVARLALQPVLHGVVEGVLVPAALATLAIYT